MGLPIEKEISWGSGGKSTYFRDPVGNLVENITKGHWPDRRPGLTNDMSNFLNILLDSNPSEVAGGSDLNRFFIQTRMVELIESLFRQCFCQW